MGGGCEKCGCKTFLCPVSLGLAVGITSGLGMMLFAWMAAYNGHGMAMMDQYATLYTGYGASFGGGVVGAIWGLMSGFICGAVIGLIYNCVHKMCMSRCESSCNKNKV